MPVRAAGAGSSSGGALGWACQADDLRDGPADLAALPVHGELGQVERVEDALHLPAGEKRVHGIHVALDGNGGGLADLPDHAPAERLLQQRRVRQRQRPGRGEPGLRGLPGLAVDAGVVDGAQPRAEQAVQFLQVLDLVAGRAGVVAGDLGQELLLDSLERAFDLAPAHRASRLTVDQLGAQHRARPGQGRIGKTRAVVRIKGARDAVRGDRGAQYGGEPDRVRAADEPGAGQEPGPVIDDARQKDGLPADLRAVHQVRGPDLVHRAGGEPAERLRRLAAGPGDQLAGLQPPLDRPHRRRPAQLGGQDPADLRAGAGRVLHLQARRQLLGLRPRPRRALPRRGDQGAEPALAARDDPPVDRPP